MDTYTVIVEETLVRAVEVEAESAHEALRKVKEMHAREEIVLDAGDFNGDVEFTVCD